MNIIGFDYDLEYGFAWINVDGNDNKNTFTVQCCLQDNKKQIKMSDCGHNWGLCLDANEEAFDYYGENRCMEALFSKAKENGFDIN